MFGEGQDVAEILTIAELGEERFKEWLGSLRLLNRRKARACVLLVDGDPVSFANAAIEIAEDQKAGNLI